MEKNELAGKITAKTKTFASQSALVLKLLLAALTVPLIIGLTRAFYDGASVLSNDAIKYFIYGFIAYLILHFLIYKPTAVYKKGQRILEILFKFFAPLLKVAPYLLPIYFILIAACFFILRHVFSINADIEIFLFLMAFSLILHLVLTAEALRDKYLGLAKANYFFGFAIIYLLNILMLAAVFHFMFTDFSFLEFFTQSGTNSFEIYQRIFNQLFV